MGYKHNWPELKKEYLSGESASVLAFFKNKNIPVSNTRHTTGWGKEKAELEDKKVEAAKDQMVKSDATNIQKIRERQARLARFLQIKGATRLEKAKSDELSVEDARKLIVSGMKEERQATGMEGGGKSKGDLTQININQGPRTHLDEIVEGSDYVEILKLIAELKRSRKRTFDAETVIEGETVGEGRDARLLDVDKSSVDDSKGEEAGVSQS